MKKIRFAIISATVIVSILVVAHLTLSVNWPEVLASLHGK